MIICDRCHRSEDVARTTFWVPDGASHPMFDRDLCSVCREAATKMLREFVSGDKVGKGVE